MKCYHTDGHGIENLKLIDCQAPASPSEREVIIDVKACSLNYRDLLVAKGQYSPGTYPRFIPLSDMAGVVRSIGNKVTELKVGDSVLNSPFRHWPAGILQSSWARSFIGGAGVDGVLAEQIVYPVDSLVKIPKGLNFVEAATLPIAGLTAWAAVVTHGKTRPGEWVLLQGTGGVSIFAAQLAHAIGARTIVMTSSDEKAKQIKERYGVTATVNYQSNDWPKKVKELTQDHGVDLVVDVVGGNTFTQCLPLCTYGARVAIIGILGGTESSLRTFDIIQHQIEMKGIFMESTQELQAFVNAIEANHLKPAIDKSFSFADAIEAYRHLEAQKHIGKVVIAF